MKNFKKVLALVLAVVMLFSFATVASAKTVTSSFYGDSADIDYEEAVDVLGAIGVLNGFPDDTFRPDATITRAQAAKIIAMFDNGSSSINGLYASANPFTDCVDNWAESFIAYCAKMGIIAGVGGTKFAPDANVTGVQFLKMALVVLGYDAKVEGLEGKNWDVNTLALAKKVGLTNTLGVKFDYSKDLKRQEAAVIMLDALRAQTVVYGSALGVNVSKFNAAVKDWLDADSPRNFSGYYLNGAVYMTVAGAVKTGELLGASWRLEETTVIDAFYRPYSAWTLKGVEIGRYMYPVAAEYHTAIDLCSVLVDLGVAKTNYSTGRTVSEYFENGIKQTAQGTMKHSVGSCNWDDKYVGKQGTLTQVFLMEDGTYRITEIDTWLGRVTKVTTKSSLRDGHLAATDVITVAAADCDRVKSFTWAADGYKVGEYVLATWSGINEDEAGYEAVIERSGVERGWQSVDSAKTEVATLKGVGTAETLVNTTWTPDAYHFHAGNSYDGQHNTDTIAYGEPFEDDLKKPVNLDKTFVFIYDAYGNVIGMATPSAGETNYVVVDWLYLEHVEGEPVLYGNVVGLDAEMKKAAVIDSIFGRTDEGFIGLANPEYGVINSRFYDKLSTYTLNSDGEYVIAKLDYSQVDDGVNIEEGKAYLQNGANKVPFTDDTLFLIHEADGTYSAATGKTIGTLFADKAQYVMDDNANFATVVYLYGHVYRQNSLLSGVITGNAAVYPASPRVVIIGDVRYIEVTIYVGDEAQTIYISKANYASFVYNPGIYTFRVTSKSAEKLICEIVAAPAEDESVEIKALSGNTLLLADGTAYKVASDAVFYDIYGGKVTGVENATFVVEGANALLTFKPGTKIVSAIYTIGD